ncbi:MAG: D-glycero-beta-D-manno-heptose 1-phosphate adenylyltransferase [Desulfovibrionaceae bacterium]|nr:D-glycero-beta-D-manno-heptose 1-phosphate adenylyltransferase [Desulfovibrionaceae bacterium]
MDKALKSRKIVGIEEFLELKKGLGPGFRLVFTNGCFDILHAGHVDLLRRARALGDGLAVGLNSDASVRAIKGQGRPLVPEAERAFVLAGLESVDYVILFDQDTPLELIRALGPDVLVKGGDWPRQGIIGCDLVEARGGRVLSLPLLPGPSTTDILRRVLAAGPGVLDLPGQQGQEK